MSVYTGSYKSTIAGRLDRRGAESLDGIPRVDPIIKTWVCGPGL